MWALVNQALSYSDEDGWDAMEAVEEDQAAMGVLRDFHNTKDGDPVQWLLPAAHSSEAVTAHAIDIMHGGRFDAIIYMQPAEQLIQAFKDMVAGTLPGATTMATRKAMWATRTLLVEGAIDEAMDAEFKRRAPQRSRPPQRRSSAS